MKKIKFFSTFTGIAGFELGIGEKGKCVGYSEIDRFAVEIYKKHFPKHINYGDISKIDPAGLPDFELLCGGFPCQSFSIAGKRGGFEDTRGTLFFDVARIAKYKRPRLLLLENVKGLLSHDGGRTFNTIIATLDELGYDLQWQVLNSKHFGVPQNRERVFIVGHIRGTPRPEVFPLSAGDEAHTIVPTLTSRYFHSQSNGAYISGEPEAGTYRTHKDGQGFRKMKGGVAPTLPARARNDGSGQPVIRVTQDGFHLRRQDKKQSSIQGSHVTAPHGKAHTLGTKHVPMTAHTLKARADSGIDPKHPQTLIRVPEATKQGYAVAQEGDSINLSVMGSKTRRGRVGKGVAQTLDTGMQQHTFAGDTLRRLTPIECERLQGFPDGWTRQGLSSIVDICVSINPAIEKWLLKLGTVSSTTRGGRGMVLQISQNESQKPVSIVLEELLQEDIAISTINRGNAMATLFNQKGTLLNATQLKESLISEKMVAKSTCKLWKVRLVGHCEKEKLSTTLTWISEIIQSITSTSSKTGGDIIGAIILFNSQEPNYSKKESLYLRTGNIAPISDTQRYKTLGNAVTVNVIRAIVEKLL